MLQNKKDSMETWTWVFYGMHIMLVLGVIFLTWLAVWHVDHNAAARERKKKKKKKLAHD